MNLRPEFFRGLIWQVGDGKTINFWTDNWAFKEPLMRYALNPLDIEDTMKVERFILNNRIWNSYELRQILPDNVVEKIELIPIPDNEITDRLYWAPSKNGWFSTASALELVSKIENYPININQWIWKLDVFPKVKNFLWKIDANGLPTKARLREKHVMTPGGCMMCNCTLEDSVHLLVKCSHSLRVTKQINANLETVLRNYNSDNKTPRTIINDMYQILGEKEFNTLAVIWWSIWHQRNNLVFQQAPDDVIQDLPSYIIMQLSNWEKGKNWIDDEDKIIQKRKERSRSQRKTKAWKKPEQGFIKINVDGSKLTNGHATGGIVIRNNEGKVIDMIIRKYGHVSIIMAEALAFRDGVREAKLRGYRQVEIEGDNSQVIKAAQGLPNCPWEIEIVMADILASLQEFQRVRVSLVNKGCNTVADKLAKMGHSFPVDAVRNNAELLVLIRKDALGLPP